MGSPKKPRVSAEKRRELQVAAAVAREALLHTHSKLAIELIALAGNRVSVMRMLDIYVRVNGLPHSDAEVVTTRVLAVLGEDTRDGERPVVYLEGEESVAESLPLVGIVRARLKGRALDDLRRWVELHTGRSQVALFNVHIVHALRFIEMLDETHGIAAALRVYTEFVAVPRAMNDMLQYFVLDRLATDGLPASAGAGPLRVATNAASPAVSLSRRDRRKAAALP